MQVVYFPDAPRPKWPQPVAALGNFDGLHRGHLKLLERVRREAGERGGTPVAVTFDPHPPRVLRPDKAPPQLMTLDQKLEGFERAGIQGVAIVRFTADLARWEPELFVETVIVDWLRAAEVWVGANFLFGRDRSGTFTLLRALGEDRGFRAEKIEPVRFKDFVVSSTRVRHLVAEGRVDEAGALLGHHYFLDGTVVHGDGRGAYAGISDGQPGDGQRAAAGLRNLRDDCHRQRRAPSVGDECGRPADDWRRPRDRGDVSARRVGGSVRRAAAAGLRAVAARGAEVRRAGAAARSDRGRLCEGRGPVSADCGVGLIESLQLMLHPFELQVPADERYRVLAPEVAAKYVELAGGSAGDGRSLASDLAVALTRLAAGAGDDAVIDLAFSAEDGHIEVTLRCAAQSTVVRHALPAARSQGT